MLFLITAQIQDCLQTVGKFKARNQIEAMKQAVSKYPQILKNCQMQATVYQEDKEHPASAGSSRPR